MTDLTEKLGFPNSFENRIAHNAESVFLLEKGAGPMKLFSFWFGAPCLSMSGEWWTMRLPKATSFRASDVLLRTAEHMLRHRGATEDFK